MQQIPLQEATQNLPSLIAATVRGEIVMITTEDQQVIQLADDFDAPLDDFREYMP